MPRIRYSYTNRWRIFCWGALGSGIYSYFNPWFPYYIEDIFMKNTSKFMNPEYEEFIRGQKWEMKYHILKNWNEHGGNGDMSPSLGLKSSSVLDKCFWGENRYRRPTPYVQVCDEFIAHCEESGVDPAKPWYDTIEKMVKYYYPEDLDPNPEETKEIVEPKVQWVHYNTFDDVIEEEEQKPVANTISRYLWFVTGYQKYFDNLKNKAIEEEESLLTSLNGIERAKYYESVDNLRERWSIELNDYAPLLAYRWDRKLKLAMYLMQSIGNEEKIVQKLMQPGGVRWLFIEADIISPNEQPGEVLH